MKPHTSTYHVNRVDENGALTVLSPFFKMLPTCNSRDDTETQSSRVVIRIHIIFQYYSNQGEILIHKKILSNSKQVGDDLGDQWFGYFLAK